MELPEGRGTGLSRGIASWAYVPPLVVAGFLTFHTWRDGA